LLNLNDHLRRLAVHEGDINVTSISPIGDQSHGKTSVISAISGVELPRGDGIKTRLPLVMMLRNLNEADSKHAKGEYATIRSSSDDPSAAPKVISLRDIPDEVDKLTSEIAGDAKDVVDVPLELTVYRKDQDDLTLIDLPGITRVAQNGQHKNIEDTIVQMYSRYMKPEEAILLNVVTAVVDFSTSKALQLSRELDPTCKRTVVCVTKVDQYQDERLADKICDASQALGIPLERIFCVRNRTQQENDSNVALSAALEQEKAFFHEKSSVFSDTGVNVGIHALSAGLVRIQRETIEATLPKTARKINSRLCQLRKELDGKAPLPVRNESSCRAAFQEKMSAFTRRLSQQCSGHFDGSIGAQFEGSKKAGSSQTKVGCLQVVFPDFAQARKRLDKSTRSTTFVSSGVHFWLEVTPSKKPKESKGSDDEVGTFTTAVYLHCQRDSSVPLVQSAETKWEIECLDAEDVSVKKGKLSRTFGGGDAEFGGWGRPDFLSPDKAGKLTDEIRFAAYVQVERVQHVSSVPNAHLLCATIHSIDSSLSDGLNSLYPNRYFFSDTFRALVRTEIDGRAGGIGLPGSIIPGVAVAIIHQLQGGLEPVVSMYVQRKSEAVFPVVRSILPDEFGSHPHVLKVLMDTARNEIEELLSKAKEGATHQLVLEHHVHTSNHYYMAIVQSVRDQLLEESRPADNDKDTRHGFAISKLGTVSKLSNEDQELLDLQIKIFAYWKTMKKRLIDQLQLSSHYWIVRSLLSRLQAAMQATAHEAANRVIRLKMDLKSSGGRMDSKSSGGRRGFVALMAPRKDIFRKEKADALDRIDLSARIDKLDQAKKMLKAFIRKSRSNEVVEG
jgi:hypothetical protein